MTETRKTDWKRMPAIKGGSKGCLCCGVRASMLPIDEKTFIAVGFGLAELYRDGEVMFSELEGEASMSTAAAEAMAKVSPEHDWRISLIGPLSESHYQRHGPNAWVLYEQGEGFA